MILCDLCGQAKDCVPKEIEGSEFDICAECWRPIEEKLKGKGRRRKRRETILLPPAVPEREAQTTPPGLPPKIIGLVEVN